jgi:hypothetical protein
MTHEQELFTSELLRENDIPQQISSKAIEQLLKIDT